MPTIVITGANRGIGLAHGEAFAAQGAKVFALCRAPDEAEALSALAARYPGQIQIVQYDGADPSSPEAVRSVIGAAPIDVLFNNAGVPDRSAFGEVTGESFLEVMRINALAPILLAQALVENIAASERRVIANQSSLMGSISQTGGGAYAYRCSKAALNMATKVMALDLAARRICVVTLHPGWVQTRMGGTQATVSVASCVEGQQAILAKAGMDMTGRFYNYDGQEIPW